MGGGQQREEIRYPFLGRYNFSECETHGLPVKYSPSPPPPGPTLSRNLFSFIYKPPPSYKPATSSPSILH